MCCLDLIISVGSNCYDCFFYGKRCIMSNAVLAECQNVAHNMQRNRVVHGKPICICVYRVVQEYFPFRMAFMKACPKCSLVLRLPPFSSNNTGLQIVFSTYSFLANKLLILIGRRGEAWSILARAGRNYTCGNNCVGTHKPQHQHMICFPTSCNFCRGFATLGP